MAKKPTKNERLIAVIDLYRQTHGATQWTTAEVSEWALAAGLYPVPAMRDPDDVHAEWERRFDHVRVELLPSSMHGDECDCQDCDERRGDN